ncbi:uncharacterized protein LOC131427441 [Malaya genurostris]|uniref:uncharacterized protein LOC131427441 n=1 Tax=Malaya genurostris TaxID=325434 RepID=UPI0026F3A5D6|nr:uncharacterized protein LOC131427441 [Malaya genurostris]
MPIDRKNNITRQSDDEEEFFKPTSNSTLAKIFGISKESIPKKLSSTEVPKSNQLSDRYGASSFRYIPPQETVESDDSKITDRTTENWKLLQASVVSAFKLINNENLPQGKLGLALLCLEAEYRIIIYRTKTDILATLNIYPSTTLMLKNSYFQFHSEDGCFWSVIFDHIMERDQLLKQINEICTIDQDDKPVPASRTIPFVELPDSDTDKTKASLITRMARVGQSIYPQDKPMSTTEVSDSSDTDVRIETLPRPNISSHRRIINSAKNYPVAIGMQMVPSSTNALNTTMSGQSMLATAADVNINMFLTENRMQNTELRMNLSKIETKLERVLDRIDLLNNLGTKEANQVIDKDEDMLQLEEKILELKRENHSLKGRIRSLETEAVTSKENIRTKNQLLETEVECEKLKDEIEKLQNDIQESHENNQLRSNEIDRLNQELLGRNEIIEKTAKDLKVLEEQIKAHQSTENSLNDANKLLTNELDCLQQTIASMEQKLVEQTKELKTNDSTVLGDMVKEIMNSCFQRISDQIDDASVLKIVGQAIKQETKSVLQKQK